MFLSTGSFLDNFLIELMFFRKSPLAAGVVFLPHGNVAAGQAPIGLNLHIEPYIQKLIGKWKNLKLDRKNTILMCFDTYFLWRGHSRSIVNIIAQKVKN